MKLIAVVTILMICVSYFHCARCLIDIPIDPRLKNPEYWSEFQGIMNWNEANAKCKSLQWRLPTTLELKQVNYTGLWKEWSENRYHWTSEEFSSESAYFVTVDNAITGYDDKPAELSVRCIDPLYIRKSKVTGSECQTFYYPEMSCRK